jgi:hypothetical protein
LYYLCYLLIFTDQFVGLLLPADLDSISRESFDKLLKEYTMYGEQTVAPDLTPVEKQKLSTQIAHYLVKSRFTNFITLTSTLYLAGEFVAWGVGKTAESASAYAARHGDIYRAKQPVCIEPARIDTRVQTSVHYLRKGTKVAVKVCDFMFIRNIVLGEWLLG